MPAEEHGARVEAVVGGVEGGGGEEWRADWVVGGGVVGEGPEAVVVGGGELREGVEGVPGCCGEGGEGERGRCVGDGCEPGA